MFLTRSIAKSTVIVSWDETSLHAGQRSIPWNQIRKIEVATPARSKWQLSASPMYALYLKDATRVHIHTDHLFGKRTEVLPCLLSKRRYGTSKTRLD